MLGHFRVPKTLTFKMSPSARPFLWKWVLFAWEWKIFSISKAEHALSLVFLAWGNSEMAYFITLWLLRVCFISLQFRHFLRVCECFSSWKHHVETPKEGQVQGRGEGVGRGKRKCLPVFFFPSPFPLSFFLPSTYTPVPLRLLFLLSPMFLCH